jgi:hypothetical protein
MANANSIPLVIATQCGVDTPTASRKREIPPEILVISNIIEDGKAIKNLASQLGLVVSNAKRHIDDPSFQQDMLQTIEDAVARMNRLLNQLKGEAASRTPRLADAHAIVASVAAALAHGPVTIETRTDHEDWVVAIDPERLKSALTHLTQNAIEASRPGDCVVISTRRDRAHSPESHKASGQCGANQTRPPVITTRAPLKASRRESEPELTFSPFDNYAICSSQRRTIYWSRLPLAENAIGSRKR